MDLTENESQFQGIVQVYMHSLTSSLRLLTFTRKPCASGYTTDREPELLTQQMHNPSHANGGSAPRQDALVG